MKKMDNVKKTVLAIGTLTTLTGIIAAVALNNLNNQLFTLYIGLTLIGSVVLHNEETETLKVNN